MKEKLLQFAQTFVRLGEEERIAFEECMQIRAFKKKEHFLVAGEVCKQIGFVVTGFMRLYYLADGADVTKSFNFENTFCGSYASFITGQHARFNVVAMEPSVLLTFNQKDLFALYDRYPNIQKLGRMSIESRFIKIEQREASLLLDTPEQRYLDVLKNEPHLLQRVPLKFLASYLGVTAETLSRIRSRLRR